MKKTDNLKVGTEVYIGRYTGHGREYAKATVVKVTPKGFADVKIGASEFIIRFNPDGDEPGRRLLSWSIDAEMTVAQRVQYVAREERERAARKIVRGLAIGKIHDFEDRQGMLNAIGILRRDLDAAHAAVLAIEAGLTAVSPLMLARKFSELLLAEIGAASLRAAVERNGRPEYKEHDSCATHDFCDANMVMLAAFESLGTPVNNDAPQLWNDAWTQAKLNGFFMEASS